MAEVSCSRRQFGIDSPAQLSFQRRIQVRADSFSGDRPTCPRGCPGRLHRHGFYRRYSTPSGTAQFATHRLLCVRCGHTVSVLPAGRLSYRPVEVSRLQAAFDVQAGIRCGLDPPPGAIEAGCLQRAWSRFLTRVDSIKDALGQMLPARTNTPQHLWKQLRRGVGPAEQMLRFLAQYCKRSLLGDYRCLRPAP